MTTDTKSADNPATAVKRATLSPQLVVVLLVLCLPLLALWGFGGDESPAKAQSLQRLSMNSSMSGILPSNQEMPAEPAPISDETYRKLIVGSWEMDRDGHRFLKVFDDGTAVMDVEIPGNWSLLFGKKLKFDIVWSIEDGVLTFETTGGEPKGKVDLITSMYGKERVQKIKKLDDATLQLPDEDPESEDHIWTRVEPAETQKL